MSLVELERKQRIWKERNQNCFVIVDSLTGQHLNIDFEVTKYPYLMRFENNKLKKSFNKTEKRVDNLIASLKTGNKVVLARC